MIRPVYLALSILELSTIVMFEFYVMIMFSNV